MPKGIYVRTKNKPHSKERKQKIGEALEGIKNPRWKGGKQTIASGYVLILDKSHPACNCRGYVYEHRLVMEKKLGRFLKQEERVHHIDRNKANNIEENLALFSNDSEHRKFHLNLMTGGDRYGNIL